MSGFAPAPVQPPDLAGFCALAGPDRLTPEGVRRQAPDASLLFANARCSLWWTAPPRFGRERLGMIGHYAAQDAASGSALLDAACDRLAAAGCTRAVGPMDGSTWRRYRLVTWRASDPPFFLEPDNPPDWPGHFLSAGFSPIAEYYSAKCDDLAAFPVDAALDARQRAAGYRIRAIDMQRIEEELTLIWRLATQSFAGNFLYAPIEEAECKAMYRGILPQVQPELVWIVERDGEPLGFSFAVPDLLQAARGEPVDTVIHKTMGFTPPARGQGLGGWVADRVFSRARELGFRRGIHALMHEANVSRKLGRGQLRDIRRYSLFARPL